MTLSSKQKLIDSGGIAYTAFIGVGTPPQQLNVIFDTGSSDLWVMSSYSLESPGYRTYDHSQSSSYSITGLPAVAVGDKYGFGASEGPLARDTITINGLADTSQVFFEAVEWSVEAFPAIDGLSGILGLGFLGISSIYSATTQYELPTVQMYNQGLFNNTLMSFKLSGAQNLDDSYVVFGDLDTSFYNTTRGIQYIPVKQSHGAYWTVSLSNIGATGAASSFNFQACAGSGSSNCVALFDTGTSYLQFDSRQAGVVAAFYAEIANMFPNGGCMIGNAPSLNCSRTIDITQVPDLTFHIYNRIYSIPATVWFRADVDGPYVARVGFISNSNNEDYFLILGDVFLQNYYTVFDRANMRIGVDISELSVNATIIEDLDEGPPCPFGLNKTYCIIFSILVAFIGLSILYLTYQCCKSRCKKNNVEVRNERGQQYYRMDENSEYDPQLEEAKRRSLLES